MDKESAVSYTREYCSVMEKNTVKSFVRQWMNLETIMLSKINQVQKVRYHVVSTVLEKL